MFVSAECEVYASLRVFEETEKKKTYTTTTKRKSFGELFWLQRKAFQAGGGYKKPIKTRKTISTTENFPLWAPFLLQRKFCTGAGRCMVSFFWERTKNTRKSSKSILCCCTSVPFPMFLALGLFQRPLAQRLLQKREAYRDGNRCCIYDYLLQKHRATDGKCVAVLFKVLKGLEAQNRESRIARFPESRARNRQKFRERQQK